MSIFILATIIRIQIKIAFLGQYLLDRQEDSTTCYTWGDLKLFMDDTLFWINPQNSAYYSIIKNVQFK